MSMKMQASTQPPSLFQHLSLSLLKSVLSWMTLTSDSGKFTLPLFETNIGDHIFIALHVYHLHVKAL